MADNISNHNLDAIYHAAKDAGASGGKISGAGGGGFMFFYCPLNTKYRVMERLNDFGGYFMKYQFTTQGVRSWKSNQ